MYQHVWSKLIICKESRAVGSTIQKIFQHNVCNNNNFIVQKPCQGVLKQGVMSRGVYVRQSWNLAVRTHFPVTENDIVHCVLLLILQVVMSWGFVRPCHWEGVLTQGIMFGGLCPPIVFDSYHRSSWHLAGLLDLMEVNRLVTSYSLQTLRWNIFCIVGPTARLSLQIISALEMSLTMRYKSILHYITLHHWLLLSGSNFQPLHWFLIQNQFFIFHIERGRFRHLIKVLLF